MPAIRMVILVVLARMASAILEHQTTEKLSPEVDQEETSTSAIAMEQSQSALMAIADHLMGSCLPIFNQVTHRSLLCPWPASADNWGRVYRKGTDTLSVFPRYVDVGEGNRGSQGNVILAEGTEDVVEMKGDDHRCNMVVGPPVLDDGDNLGFNDLYYRCDNVAGDSAPFQTLKHNIYDILAYKTRVARDPNTKNCNAQGPFCCGEGKWVDSVNQECKDTNIQTVDQDGWYHDVHDVHDVP